MKMNGLKLDTQTILLASILDRASILAWMQSEDARKGRNRPESVLSALLGEERSELVKFGSGDELEAYFDKIRKGVNT